MYKAFIQTGHKYRTVFPANTAWDGLNQLGYETIWFTQEQFDANEVPITKDTLVVGFIETYRTAIARLGLIPPDNIDVPDELVEFAGRKVWNTTLAYARQESNWPVFIKPLKQHKEFPGQLVTRFRDLFSSSTLSSDFEILASEPVDFVSEYRCFVCKGDIVGVRPYKGNPLVYPDGARILAMVRAWSTAPAACCIDIGITRDGRTLLIEVNDGHSMGDYGLHSIVYARLLEARWCELTGASPIP